MAEGRVYSVSLELEPGSPHQRHVVSRIEAYLEGKVDDPAEVALHVWRLTRIEFRPVATPK